ncbi:hypothetical protein PG997_009180 [Apiospora hydei]|uniref:Uncharacterized protein n=1 Tax=Apiospora hydei TaxID=1337664 RepID=A0ABR1VTL2_9PEZI
MSTTLPPSSYEQLPPPTPPPTRPPTPDSMTSDASSPQQAPSPPPEQQEPQSVSPPPADDPLTESLFGPPPTAATTSPPHSPNDSIHHRLRPLDHYFGPHLNHDLKQRRAVHEYMLCRMTQDQTTLYIHRAILALLLLLPPSSSSSSSSAPATSFEAEVDDRLIWELASLLQHEAALHAATARTVRTMWLLGLPRPQRGARRRLRARYRAVFHAVATESGAGI